jgi:hypothetical protein
MEMSFRNKTNAGSTKLCVRSPAKKRHPAAHVVRNARNQPRHRRGRQHHVGSRPKQFMQVEVSITRSANCCRCHRLLLLLQLNGAIRAHTRAFLDLEKQTHNRY